MINEAKQGGEIPPSLASKPKLSDHLVVFYDAFQILNCSRQITMGGPASIPFSEIASYLAVYEIRDAAQKEDYITYIQALDGAYLSYHHSLKPKGKS